MATLERCREQGRDGVAAFSSAATVRWSARGRDLELRIPKLRRVALPGCWSGAGGWTRAPFAVVMEAYLHGACTRKVDDLVGALRADSGISNSEVSRIFRQPTDLAVGACIPLARG